MLVSVTRSTHLLKKAAHGLISMEMKWVKKVIFDHILYMSHEQVSASLNSIFIHISLNYALVL